MMTHQLSQPNDPCLECGAVCDCSVDGYGEEVIANSAWVDYLDKSYHLKFWLCRSCALNLVNSGKGPNLGKKILVFLDSIQPPWWGLRFWRWLWS